MSQSVVSDCMFTTLHWVEYTRLIIINSNVYHRLATQLLWVQFTPSLSDVYISRSDCMFTALHWVEYTLLIIINSDVYNRLATQLLWVQFTPSPSVASIGRFWLYVYCPELNGINIVDYNQLKRIQWVSYAAVVGIVYSITQWCLNQSVLMVCLLPYIG